MSRVVVKLAIPGIFTVAFRRDPALFSRFETRNIVIGRKEFSKIDELFDAALSRPPEERLRFVDEACEGDAALAAEVRKLLELSADAGEDKDSLFPSGALKGPLWEEVARELQNGTADDELAAGSYIGPYEIVGLLGRGGMGSVYRARDPGLGRDVAIKVLTRELGIDGSTMKRFEREAKLLASLNHPNIASIYDLLQVDDHRYLILELVEGETLAERLERGPLELPELLAIAEQIADALGEAHRKGVIHRDLKPSNIKLTPDGRVKILDFGLAKTYAGLEGQEPARTVAPALPTTQAGVVLGTPGYMSPEQARGTSVDKRTDVWAFGCLLYEMVTGRRAFGGKTASDAIAAVLRDDVDWGRFPTSTPRQLRRLVRRCLQQDPRERVQDIGDARLEIVELSRQDSQGLLVEPASGSAGRWIALAALAAFLAGMAFFRAVGFRGNDVSVERRVTRTTLALGPEVRLWSGASASLALSPDGERVAVVGDRDGQIQLYVREIGSYELTLVRGSDGARDPFFSPDGKWIGFFAQGEIKKVAVEHGVAESITEAGLQSRGASWGEHGEIVFAQDSAPGLFAVSEDGGEPRALSNLGDDAGRVEHFWPQWLPGGESLLFTIRTAGTDGVSDELAVLDLDSGTTRVIGHGAQAALLASGHVVYVRGRAIEAAVFDASALALDGSGKPLVQDVNIYPGGAATFAVSRSGTLAYMERSDAAVFQIRDDEGRSISLDLPGGTPGWPRINSERGNLAALHLGGADSRDVWVLDLDRPGSIRQLTFQGGGFPTWSADGSRIAFMSRRGGSGDIYTVATDGSGSPERLLGGPRTQIPVSWSPQGMLAFYEIGDITQRDIWVVDVDAGSDPVLFVATPANELSPMFSPDGEFLAYVSNETGQNEVYVRPYPPPGAVTAVSIDGGSEPIWSHDGTELYYRHGDVIMSVTVTTDAGFRVGSPREVLAEPPLPGAGGNPNYDVFPDGRFLVRHAAPGTSIDLVRLVIDWNEELRKIMPNVSVD